MAVPINIPIPDDSVAKYKDGPLIYWADGNKIFYAKKNKVFVSRNYPHLFSFKAAIARGRLIPINKKNKTYVVGM